MKIYIHMPSEYFGKNLSPILDETIYKLKQDYTRDSFVSNYTGNGTIEDSDMVVILYEFKDLTSSQEVIEHCKNLKKPYRISRCFYRPDKFYDLWN